MVALLAILLYFLLFLLVALVSGNNLPACSGPIISGRIVSRRTGIMIAVLGYASGFLIEGGLLKTGLLELMPFQSGYLVAAALSVAIAVFLIAHTLRVPESLSITFTMSIIGIDLGYGSGINLPFILMVIFFWIISAAASGLLAAALMKSANRVVPKLNIWKTASAMRITLIAVSFLAAFSLGANTIGFVYASASSFIDPFYGIVIALAAVVSGSVLLSKGELGRMGAEIMSLRYLNALVCQTVSTAMVQLGTALSIPTSNAQTFTSSMYGAGFSYRTRLLLMRPMLTILYAWIVTAMISMLLGYALTFAIYHL